MYPSELLWLYNGKVIIRDDWSRAMTFPWAAYLQTSLPIGPHPLPVKLYRFYLNKNIEYTHFKNIDDKVYETYDEIPEHEYNIGNITV